MEVGDRVRMATTAETATVVMRGQMFPNICRIELDNGEECYADAEELIPIREVSCDPVRIATRRRMRRHLQDGRPL